MIKDWQRHILEGIVEFERQGEGAYAIQIIPASCWDSIIKAGDAGDMDARRLIFTLNNWFEIANSAAGADTFPGCLSCETKITHGHLGGWALVMPREVNKTGLVSAICEECIRRNFNELIKQAVALIENETGKIALTVQ